MFFSGNSENQSSGYVWFFCFEAHPCLLDLSACLIFVVLNSVVSSSMGFSDSLSFENLMAAVGEQNQWLYYLRREQRRKVSDWECGLRSLGVTNFWERMETHCSGSDICVAEMFP